MAVDAQLGIERKVAAELEKEGAEIPVYRIDVVVVHHCGRTHDPWIGLAGFWISAPLGAEHRRLLLSLADEYYPFLFLELGQMLRHHLVFALPLVKLQKSNFTLRHEALHCSHKASAHLMYQRRI